MNSLNKFIVFFDEWIHNFFPMTLGQLGLFRILFCLYMIFVFGVPNFSFLGEFLSFAFTPPALSIAALFDGFPSRSFFIGMSLLLNVLFVLLLFGYQTRKVSIATSLIMLLGYNFFFSFGKIDHNILMVVLPLVMAFSNWGAAFSVNSSIEHEKEQGYSSWTVTLMALLLGFGMFSAGIPKLLTGWLDFSTHAVQGHFFHNYHIAHRNDLLAPYFNEMGGNIIWELMDWLAVFFEIGFLFALIKPNVFKFFVFLALCFHLVNLLIFNISFTSHLGIYLLFVNWNYIEEKVISTNIKNKIRSLLAVENMLFAMFIMLGYTVFVIKQELLPLWSNPSPLKFIFAILKLEDIYFSLILFIGVALLGAIQIIYFMKKRLAN